MKILISLFFICFGPLLCGDTEKPQDVEENTEVKKDKKEQKEHTKGNVVIYKDRSIATLPVSLLANKPHRLPVAASIDSQSILFQQKNHPNVPEYSVVKDKDVKMATAADLVLNSAEPFDGELTYNFSGLDWHMHYVIEVDEQFNEVKTFNSFISVDNQSGVDFKNVFLRLIDMNTDVLAKNHAFNEYFVPLPQFLEKGKVLRIPWVNLQNQKSEQDYRLDVGGENLVDLQGSERHIPLQIWLGFKLDSKAAKDLASGEMCIYVNDKSDNKRYLGTTSMQAIKPGDDIQIGIPPHLLTQLKSNQDSPLSQIQGKLEQTEFKTLLTEKVIEAAYRLTIRNFGKKEATIKVILPFGKNRGKVIRESMAHREESSQNVYWPVKVAPQSELVLRYRVQLMKE